MLTPSLVRNDAHGIREIQAAVRRTHRNVQATIRREPGEEGLTEPGRFAAERNDIARPVIDIVIASMGSRTQQALSQPIHSLLATRRRQLIS